MTTRTKPTRIRSNFYNHCINILWNIFWLWISAADRPQLHHIQATFALFFVSRYGKRRRRWWTHRSNYAITPQQFCAALCVLVHYHLAEEWGNDEDWAVDTPVNHSSEAMGRLWDHVYKGLLDLPKTEVVRLINLYAGILERMEEVLNG